MNKCYVQQRLALKGSSFVWIVAWWESPYFKLLWLISASGDAQSRRQRIRFHKYTISCVVVCVLVIVLFERIIMNALVRWKLQNCNTCRSAVYSQTLRLTPAKGEVPADAAVLGEDRHEDEHVEVEGLDEDPHVVDADDEVEGRHEQLTLPVL